MANSKVKRRKNKQLNNWQIFMGWFIGFLIIGLILPAIISLNFYIGILVGLIFTIGDLIFFNWAISKFIINLFR